MIWAYPQDLKLYARSSYYYDNYVYYIPFFRHYFEFINYFSL